MCDAIAAASGLSKTRKREHISRVLGSSFGLLLKSSSSHISLFVVLASSLLNALVSPYNPNRVLCVQLQACWQFEAFPKVV